MQAYVSFPGFQSLALFDDSLILSCPHAPRAIKFLLFSDEACPSCQSLFRRNDTSAFSGRALLISINDQQDVATAALYLGAKPSAHPVSPRQILVVFNYLCSRLNTSVTSLSLAAASNDANAAGGDWVVSEGQYETARTTLYKIESHILRVLGFQTQVGLPYNLCINYLQSLDVFTSDSGSKLARRAFAQLNTALLSPQLLYLTHQPSALATAAIYLAAREVDMKLPEVEWWEVFDVDREELGFLVVALRSVEGYALEEKRKWGRRNVPMTVDDIRLEVERMQMLDNGE